MSEPVLSQTILGSQYAMQKNALKRIGGDIRSRRILNALIDTPFIGFAHSFFIDNSQTTHTICSIQRGTSTGYSQLLLQGSVLIGTFADISAYNIDNTGVYEQKASIKFIGNSAVSGATDIDLYLHNTLSLNRILKVNSWGEWSFNEPYPSAVFSLDVMPTSPLGTVDGFVISSNASSGNIFKVCKNNGTGAVLVDTNFDLKMQKDSGKIHFGAGDDATIYYNGTDLIVSPKVVGTGRVDILGNLKCDQVWLLDSEKVVLGTGSDVELYYDGTDAKIVTDVVAASDLVVDCGTDKTIELAETVWDEIRVPWTSTYFDATLVNPWGAYIVGSIPLLWFIASGDLSTAFVVRLPHDWKEGTNLYPHVHWSPLVTADGTPANQVVKWTLEYSWANNGTDLPGSTTESMTVHSPADANVVKGRVYTTAFSAITPGANSDEISSTLVGRLMRYGTDASDTYENYAGLISLDFYYEIDTIGSRTQTAK